MNRLQLAIERIQFTRGYTLSLLKDIRAEEWFQRPTEGVTHLAWQIGHLVVAEYAMGLKYVIGVQPHHESLIPPDYFRLFGRGSKVETDPQQHPGPDRIRQVLDAVHARVPLELAGLKDDELDQPPTSPHPAFSTKFGALLFCGEHEMVHAGQIGLLRRLLGHEAIR